MVDFLNEITKWIIYFFIYSIVGWIFESAYCSLKAKPPHFINRGFCFGPLCPIYGTGLVAVAFLMQPFGNLDPVAKFLVSAGVCTVIEYIASFAMEKLFHVRWWSYKNSWYNFTINGRVSFWTSVGFGLGGLFVLTYIHPNIVDFVDSFTFGAKMAISVSCVILFILDNYMSSAAASSVKYVLKGGKVDLTDEIKRYAINYYRKQSRKTRRLAKQLIRTMKRTQKRALKEFKRTQKRITSIGTRNKT